MAYTLKKKNEEAHYENEDNLRNTFGTKATVEELYMNGNMVKFNINLFTKKVTDIPKETSVMARYSNTIKEILEASCSFWGIKEEDYILTNSKYVVLPLDMTAGKIFVDSNGNQMIELLMHNKYTLCFDIIKQQEEAIEINKNTSNAQGNQSDQKLNKRIEVRKEAVAKLDNAPEKFFEK